MPNIPGLDKLLRMDDNFDVSDEEDSSTADFDAELAAIVSGVNPPIRKPTPSSKVNAKGPQSSSTNKQAGVKRQAPGPPPGIKPLDLKQLERIAMMSDNFDDGDDDDIGEEDLEAELAALMGTLTPQSPKKEEFKPPVPPRSKIIVSTVVVRYRN